MGTGEQPRPASPVPSRPGDAEERSWLRRHIVEVVITILVAAAGYFAVSTIEDIKDRLSSAETTLHSVQLSFISFKAEAQTADEKLRIAIQLVSDKADKQTRRAVQLILRVQQEQKNLQSSIKSVGQETENASRQVIDIRSELARVPSSAEVDAVGHRLDSLETEVASAEVKLRGLSTRAEAADRERIILEAKRRLSQFDEQYLYSKAHEQKSFKIWPGSGFVGQTVRIVTPEEEYQLSSSLNVDFQDGVLILSGRVKSRETKTALKKLLGTISGVRTVDDILVEVEEE